MTATEIETKAALKRHHHEATGEAWSRLLKTLEAAGIKEPPQGRLGEIPGHYEAIINAVEEYKAACILQDRDGIDPIAD